MKFVSVVALAAAVFGAVICPSGVPSAGAADAAGDFVQQFDSAYNTITIARKGAIVEMRARLNERSREYIESAINLDDPLRLVVPYTRTLFAGLFLQPEPHRVLMIGLGGGGFHRLFVFAHPEALLHTVEIDAKVLELAETYMGFRRLERMPVTIQDGRNFVRENQESWDWIVLDAFRGGFVPPHLKTQEFYRECAARLSDRGVLISNLHDGTKLYSADLKTLASVFPQVVLFGTPGRGNVIACAVKYREPDMTNPANWASVAALNPRFAGWLDLQFIRDERIPWPKVQVDSADVLTDDFNPAEILNVIEENNQTQEVGEGRAGRRDASALLLYGGGTVILLFGAVLVWRVLRRR